MIIDFGRQSPSNLVELTFAIATRRIWGGGTPSEICWNVLECSRMCEKKSRWKGTRHEIRFTYARYSSLSRYLDLGIKIQDSGFRRGEERKGCGIMCASHTVCSRRCPNSCVEVKVQVSGHQEKAIATPMPRGQSAKSSR